jgi:hypothetical protein
MDFQQRNDMYERIRQTVIASDIPNKDALLATLDKAQTDGSSTLPAWILQAIIDERERCLRILELQE